MRLLLDTCACLWIIENAKLAKAAVEALDQAFDDGEPVFVSPFTAWEVGLLSSRGRIVLTTEPLLWFRQLMAIPGAQPAPLGPEILVSASYLPGAPPRDPADRIIIATARHEGFTVVTRDRLILDYAETGYLQAIAC